MNIEALANSQLAPDRTLSVPSTAPVFQYIYAAFPSSYGPATALDFQFGAFPGGFQLVGTVSVTANTPGAPAQNYDLWRSTFQQDTTVTGPQPFTIS